jgi:hypothetical protein
MERYRITSEAAVNFLTYAVVEWLPVFIREATCKIVTESLTFCHRHKHSRSNAFVVMPTHMHLIVFDAEFDTKRLLPTLLDFRKFTGRQRSGYGRDHPPSCFPKTLRQQATADRKRRFWQPSRHPESIAPRCRLRMIKGGVEHGARLTLWQRPG